MPDSLRMDFTVEDHDAVRDAAAGVKYIISQLAILESRMVAIEARVRTVENWRLAVMAIVLCLGVMIGFALNAIGALSKFYSVPVAQSVPAGKP